MQPRLEVSLGVQQSASEHERHFEKFVRNALKKKWEFVQKPCWQVVCVLNKVKVLLDS